MQTLAGNDIVYLYFFRPKCTWEKNGEKKDSWDCCHHCQNITVVCQSVSECVWVRTTRTVWKMSGGERGRWLTPNRRSLHFFPSYISRFFYWSLWSHRKQRDCLLLSLKANDRGASPRQGGRKSGLWVMVNLEKCVPSLKCSRGCGGAFVGPAARGHRTHLSFTKLVIFISKRCSACQRGSQI